jgi:mannose/cellobiose epimerase-like protein (N-acyl-D-glucosamine 2-epimerase family)
MRGLQASEGDALAKTDVLGHCQKAAYNCFEDVESNRDMHIERLDENGFVYDDSRFRSQARQVFLWYRCPASKRLT